MGMVALQQRIASAFYVLFGRYGDVRRYAQDRGVCRQWIYREAARIQELPEEKDQKIEAWRKRAEEAEANQAALQERLAASVVLDEDLQAHIAAVGQANGVSLPVIWLLLAVPLKGKQLSVASLGRRSQEAGKKSGELLTVFDAWAKKRARAVAGDELYVNDPVRMVVEQDSLCWLSGRLGVAVDGAGWAEEFRALPNLEQVARDGGKGLEKGVALVNAERHQRKQPLVVDKGDHFHAQRGAGPGLRKVQKQAAAALAQAEQAQRELEEDQQQGRLRTQGAGKHAAALWRKAETAMDLWCQRERCWEQAKEALRLVTPTGELNSRHQAEAVLAQTLPLLPDRDFGKTKRQMQKPEMLNYLDHVHEQIKALPYPEEVKQAAVRQECLRRRPEALQGQAQHAAANRGILLLCALILGKAGNVGLEAVAAIRDILRRAYRASSLVECLNSAVRMHQGRHRKMTQGLIDLKRLYWNCHTFRTGRRRNTTPYGRLGVPWPEGLSWWEVLKLTPEQLQEKLSTAQPPL
jgi:hypothetical protein